MSKLRLSRAVFQQSSCSNADFKDIHQTHLRTVFTDYNATCAHGIRTDSSFPEFLFHPRHKIQFSVRFYGILNCHLRPEDLISHVKDRSIKDANL